MSASENQSTKKLIKDFTRTWRYKIGLGLIIIGNVGLVIGILLPLLGLAPGGKAGLVGVLIVGGEVVSLSSIIFLGMEGFKTIKSKVFGFVRGGYVARVGPVRHYIGIALFCTNILTTLLMALYAWDTFDRTTTENPMPAVWGLNFAEQGELVTSLFLIGEISFLTSIYVLGADWWGRFRDLFVWKNPDRGEGSNRSRRDRNSIV